MVPAPLLARNANTLTTKLLYPLLSLCVHHASHLLGLGATQGQADTHILAKRGVDEKLLRTVFAALIPVLVLLSGVFAGLTLGYMSLDETQLNVLSISGTPQQREYASKIKPIRKNGHLLLVTLLLANMIVNETLPVISTRVFGDGILGVAISTVLIIIFAEIIPQSLCTRHGLYLGAKMATFIKILIILLGVIAWPVAKLLEWALGPHHGIIYRRAELKELIALHSSDSPHGGDLKIDTVTIIGATLDLQEKVVKQAMTPIEDVFMLSIDSKLDYDLLKKIVQTGHSRVPVYEEIDVPIPGPTTKGAASTQTQKMKTILGILLVKQCVLLDPKDATPLRKIPLNKVPFVPNNEPLLGILDKFQGGRSHMAIVSRFSVDKAISVKKAAKRSLTQRLRERVMGDSDSSDDGDGDGDAGDEEKAIEGRRLSIPLSKSGSKETEEATLREDPDAVVEYDFGNIGQKVTRSRFKSASVRRGGNGRKQRQGHTSGSRSQAAANMTNDEKDIELDEIAEDVNNNNNTKKSNGRSSFQIPKAAASMASISNLEQTMPADAVLNKEGAEEFLKNFDPAVMPLGIITLEDVLEELIGEEIYDEFDPQGARGDPYQVPPEAETAETTTATETGPAAPEPHVPVVVKPTPLYMPALKNLTGLGFLRPKSAPPVPRDAAGQVDTEKIPMPMPPSPQLQDDAPTQVARPERRPSLPPSGLSAPVPHHGHVALTSTDPIRPATVHSFSTAATTTTTGGMGLSAPPPLEAVLLERKRRLAAGGSGVTLGGVTNSNSNVGTGPSASALPQTTESVSVGGVSSGLQPTTGRSVTVSGPKVTRFKSSPLVEGEVAGKVSGGAGEEKTDAGDDGA